MKKHLVIYHDKCTDGFGAAFAAWLKLGGDAEYVACSYGDGKFCHPADIRDSVDGRQVYILDFSFPIEVMKQFFAESERVVWLDHHKTAFEMWCGKMREIYEPTPATRFNKENYVLLDSNKSGAMLAWEFFHPNILPPRMIRHIDDRDRWQFKLEYSKELHAALASIKPWNFLQWKELDQQIEHWDNQVSEHFIFREGAAILRAQNSDVDQMAKQALKVTVSALWEDGESIGEHPARQGLAVNSCLHQSELGHVLAIESGTYGLVWYIDRSKMVNCSLRSNGDYDVSKIANAFGGGGHKNAAGFQCEIATLLGFLK